MTQQTQQTQRPPHTDARLLPTRNSQFVAYSAPERLADPQTHEPVVIRPQVYVEFYSSLLVKEVQMGGRTGQKDTVRVVFDPASSTTELHEDISASLDPRDPLVSYLNYALANQRPVSVGVETQRRQKTRRTGDPINRFAPIHALRGAQTPDGPGDTNVSGDNVLKKVALIDGYHSTLLASNPAEWAMLATNKTGDLPPEGWQNYASRDDWKQIGTIVPAVAPQNPAPQQAPTTQQAAPLFSPDALRAALVDALTSAEVRALLETSSPADAPVARTNRGPANQRFSEGKPWDLRTSDGRINLGSYAVGSEGWAFRWSYKYLSAHGEEGATASVEDAWEMADFVTRAASKVQSLAYAAMVNKGEEAAVDPNAMQASYRESEHWTEWVIENLHPFPFETDEEDETEHEARIGAWIDLVVEGATALLATSGHRVGARYAEKAAKERAQRQQGPARPAASRPQGPDPIVVQALLDQVAASWDRPDVLRTLGGTANEKGFISLVVSMAPMLDGATRPKITFPAVQGEPSGPLGGLLTTRLTELAARGPQAETPSAPVVTQPEQAPAEQAPAEPESGAPAEPVEPAPAAEYGSHEWEDDSAPEASAAANSVSGYDPAVRDALARAQSLTPSPAKADLAGLFRECQKNNLLQATVSVQFAPDMSMEVGQPGQPGFEEITLADVLNRIRLGNAPTEAPAETSNEDAPEAEGTPGEDTETQDSPSPTAEESPADTPDPVEASSQENTPEPGTPESAAQEIVVQATADGVTLETLQALRERAQKEGLNAVRVSAVLPGTGKTPSNGPLGGLLRAMIVRAQRQGA